MVVYKLVISQLGSDPPAIAKSLAFCFSFCLKNGPSFSFFFSSSLLSKCCPVDLLSLSLLSFPHFPSGVGVGVLFLFWVCWVC